jgi:hypothetical protein
MIFEAMIIENTKKLAFFLPTQLFALSLHLETKKLNFRLQI